MRDADAVQRVQRAMSGLDRRAFLPPEQHRFADADQPLPIGHHATCSQPSTVARMLTLLDARPGQRVLDVGSGSGWTTAILAELVAPGGEVVGVELEPALVATGRANLAAVGVTAVIEPAVPGALGLPHRAPFERILVSAESRGLPHALVDQLTDGGRMVAPVGGRLVVADLTGGELTTRALGTYRFVPLRQP